MPMQQIVFILGSVVDALHVIIYVQFVVKTGGMCTQFHLYLKTLPMVCVFAPVWMYVYVN